ncbi:DUF2637 domain-containing protein [Streptomyces sp. NPDC007074]|uniref:DUF2637 domain-containing protein n=1 Tax=Streptomyces sp. NPDC007074 TaxID=3156764 RepID=UPI0033FB3A57
MTTTPAGNEPHRLDGGPLAPTAPGTPPTTAITLTRTQKILIGIVAAGVLTIATLGFIGSYNAVTALATAKHFGSFAKAFPIAIDAGIIAFLSLDLLLTWLRMPYPMLRHGAWLLTAATIAFNAAAAWPDKLGVSMHAVIPVLFVIAVEAARHAVGRIADITADKHIESPPVSRWLLNPAGTFVLWRRQRMWGIRKWDTVVSLEQERRIYRAQLRNEHGRGWRRKATAAQRLVLELSADGMSIQEAIDRPHREAQQQAEAEAKRQAELRAKAEAEAEAKHEAELRQAEVEAKRRAEVAEAEAAEARARAEAEAAAEVARLEVEAKRRSEAEAGRVLVAETEAKLAEIARAQQQAEAEAELNRQRQAAEAALLRQQEAQTARQAAETAARLQREDKARERARAITSEAASTSGSGTTRSASPTTSGTASTSASGPRAIGPQRGKRQSEVEAVLARLVEANDPKSVSLAEVMDDFGLSQTTAYDRLKTAQELYAKAQESKSA